MPGMFIQPQPRDDSWRQTATNVWRHDVSNPLSPSQVDAYRQMGQQRLRESNPDLLARRQAQTRDVMQFRRDQQARPQPQRTTPNERQQMRGRF